MKTLFLFTLSLLTSIVTQGQGACGTLTNPDKKPVPYAQINILGEANHTHSNEDGSFCIEKLSTGDTLEVQVEGYETLLWQYKGDRDQLKIELVPLAISLEAFSVSAQKETQDFVSNLDLKINPVSSSQELLRQVPGLFIGQHAGGGKAEQIFIRGFDVDHGTDVSIDFDGMPVNMVSHAHGQGYADLHFILPEVLNQISFDKGSYNVRNGNFNTAAAVGFKSRSSFEDNELKLTLGQFNTRRMYLGVNLLDMTKHKLMLAASLLQSDGPFISSQNFNRKNYFLKYTGQLDESNFLSLSLSGFSSSWDASGQIPWRAVDSGMISRFGAIDDTEGGNSSRHNLILNHTKSLGNQSQLKNTLYLGAYDFQLWSNFTFFLEDSLNGDQILQKENRSFMGFQSVYSKKLSTSKLDISYNLGLGLRYDNSRGNELSRTKNREETIEHIQLGDIEESNYFAFTDLSIRKKKFTFTPGFRVDNFDYQYRDRTAVEYKQTSKSEFFISPKLRIDYLQNRSLGLYVNVGKGYHSNDTRRAISMTDKNPTPASYGADLGLNWKATDKLFFHTALWGLYLEEEFVYVGDAGIVEPSGETRRVGADFSTRLELSKRLFFNMDLSYAFARAKSENDYDEFIPLAPSFTMTNGIRYTRESGFYLSLNSRYMMDRPANEDYSITAKGYFVIDGNVGMEWKKINLQFSVKNLLNAEWEETQFATLSQLRGETVPVEEIHFTPGTPFFAQFSLSYKF
jgi:hypothetical protein